MVEVPCGAFIRVDIFVEALERIDSLADVLCFLRVDPPAALEFVYVQLRAQGELERGVRDELYCTASLETTGQSI